MKLAVCVLAAGASLAVYHPVGYVIVGVGIGMIRKALA